MHRFLRLPTDERWLLIKTALLLEAIKLGTRLLPFQTLRCLLYRATDVRAGSQHMNRLSTEKISWAVKVASQHTPGAKTCLVQALATQVLLSRRSYSTLLHIGVVGGEWEQFQAHAWVETEGKIVIGGPELQRYTPLTVLEQEGFGESRDQKL